MDPPQQKKINEKKKTKTGPEPCATQWHMLLNSSGVTAKVCQRHRSVVRQFVAVSTAAASQNHPCAAPPVPLFSVLAELKVSVFDYQQLALSYEQDVITAPFHAPFHHQHHDLDHVFQMRIPQVTPQMGESFQ